MSVSKDEVFRIGVLARLHLTEAEAERMTKDMNDILAYVEKLGEVDTGGVSPLSFLEQKRTPVEPDRVRRFENVEEALSNAPRAEGRFFMVPRVIE